MPILIIIILVLLIVFAPQWWATYTFKRYARPRNDIPGTGAEFARHLLDRFEMTEVKVEQTDQNYGDHYDPRSKTVRLSPKNFGIKSLTAMTVAAHEVGHAIQHHRNERMLHMRTRLVGIAAKAEKFGAIVFVALPFIALLSRSPGIGIIMLFAIVASMGTAALVHFITLPVEIDASFGKAMPILQQGKYLKTEDERGARRILRAAALTYLAASLASILNLWRWLIFLRR